MTARITVADYGIGNLLSVVRAFEHCQAEVDLTREPIRIASADRLVVPGVGAFGDCIGALARYGVRDAVREHAASGRPWLGICVGMQMMLDASEEFGEHAGLGLIPGRCAAIPRSTVSGEPHKIPHIGWNRLFVPVGRDGWYGTILEGIESSTAFYFVHSFNAEPGDEKFRLAETDYNGRRITAALQRDNLFGTQFHPEKSGPAGLRVLERFLAI